jgi:hypothetical protein
MLVTKKKKGKTQVQAWLQVLLSYFQKSHATFKKHSYSQHQE